MHGDGNSKAQAEKDNAGHLNDGAPDGNPSSSPPNNDEDSNSLAQKVGNDDSKAHPSAGSTVKTQSSGLLSGAINTFTGKFRTPNSKPPDGGNQDGKPDPSEDLQKELDKFEKDPNIKWDKYETVKNLKNLAGIEFKIRAEEAKKSSLDQKKREQSKGVTLPSSIDQTKEDHDKVEKRKEERQKLLKRLMTRLKMSEDEFKKAGQDAKILALISEQNYEDKSRMRKYPILGIAKPKSYKLNEYREKRNTIEYLIIPYTIICGVIIIVESIAIAMDFTSSDVYKQITIIMFAANMVSTAMIIKSLAESEVRISSLEGENSDNAIFSLGLSLILTTILLLPWTYILRSEYVPGFDPCNTQIVVMASIGMIVLYSFVSYILINSLIKMSKVLKTYIHDGREVVCSNDYVIPQEGENAPEKKVSYHVLYTKDPDLIRSEFLESLNKIKRFKKFLKSALLWSLPELLLSVVLTTIIVFKVKQLSVLTLLFINCSMYPFSLLLVSSIMFNNKIRAFESQRNLDTDLIIDFMGVEITQSWLLGLLSPLYTFLIKLYGMSGATS